MHGDNVNLNKFSLALFIGKVKQARSFSTGVIAIGVMLTQMHVPRKTPMDGKPGLESGATGIPWFVKAFAVLVSPQVRGPINYLCIIMLTLYCSPRTVWGIQAPLRPWWRLYQGVIPPKGAVWAHPGRLSALSVLYSKSVYV